MRKAQGRWNDASRVPVGSHGESGRRRHPCPEAMGDRTKENPMADVTALLDAYAEARRTWDDLIALQPDVVLAGGSLSDADLSLLSERVSAHLVAGVTL